MKFSIEAIDRGSFVQIKFFGIWTKTESDQVFTEMATAIISSGYYNVMFDYTESEFMEGSIFMDYDEAEEMSRLPRVFEYNFVSVFSSDDELKRFSYWEEIARSKNIKIKFFSNEDSAIKWLLK